MLRQRKLRIPIWYYRKADYYRILIDEMIYGSRIGWLVFSGDGIKYRKVPFGKGIAVDIKDIGEELNE